MILNPMKNVVKTKTLLLLNNNNKLSNVTKTNLMNKIFQLIKLFKKLILINKYKLIKANLNQ